MTNPITSLNETTEETVSAVLAQELHGEIAYSPELGWMEWGGQKWRQDPEGLLTHRAIANRIAQYVTETTVQNLPAPQQSRLMRLRNNAKQKVIQERLRSLLLVPVDEWDAYPHLLNCPNGTLDLNLGILSPHDPADYLTRITGADYIPGATHDDWWQALEAMPQEQPREWMQGHLGSGAWGLQRSDRLALFTGTGANGKSTIVGGVLGALGDYAATADRSVIVGKGHGEYKAELRGLRLAVIEELDDGHKLNTAEVKSLLGTRSIKARHLYKAAMEFPAQFTLVITTNYRPQVPETDAGTWRRLARLDFSERFTDDTADEGLRGRVAEGRRQREAVLAWLVEGALAPLPRTTPGMELALENWQLEVDSIAEYINEHVTTQEEGWTTRKEIYENFCAFLDERGQNRWTMRTFHGRWTSHQTVENWLKNGTVVESKRMGHRGWKGLVIHRSPGF